MIDEAQFTALCETLPPTLRRIALGILRSEADADDAVQQALLNAWRARQKAEPRNLRAWITRITVNECRNIQRARMRVTPVETPRDENESYEPPDIALRDAIAALPDMLRLPLLIKYMEGYSERETAQALRLPVTTVKNRLYRARKALAKALEEEVILE